MSRRTEIRDALKDKLKTGISEFENRVYGNDGKNRKISDGSFAVLNTMSEALSELQHSRIKSYQRNLTVELECAIAKQVGESEEQIEDSMDAIVTKIETILNSVENLGGLIDDLRIDSLSFGVVADGARATGYILCGFTITYMD